jgi:hypothetical protein
MSSAALQPRRCRGCGNLFTPSDLHPWATACRPACRRPARPQPDPSPAEILERAAQVRAGWTEAELLARLRADWHPWLVLLHVIAVPRPARLRTPAQ